MKVSLNWLREFVELPASTEALIDLLTFAGVEVEGVEQRGVTLEKVVVAQILESAQHPNADRLSVCKVDDGSGETRQIVCGAKNYKVGDKVPLALPGAVLPGDFKIKVGKLRGVESAGMLCSAKELQLADDADGLLILPESAQVGAAMSEVFPADTVLDLEVTPNRADLLCHKGMAREIAALTGKTLSFTKTEIGETREDGSVRIEAREACPFYTARRIAGVKVAQSPEWLRLKLEAVGLRAINNVVDVTNLVMLEMWQPLHAFDAEKLSGGIVVRKAEAGEKFLALDGREYALSPEHLLIADDARGVAIAGVMGGEETGVTEATVDVLLESAYFAPSGIRRTARELGLGSDSSYRFERGVDPAGVLAASERAARLIVKLAGGEAENFTATAGELPDFSRVVELRPERAGEVLGAEVPEAEVARILTGFGLEQAGEGWRVPSYRQDLTREIDLVEEVARVWGMERIPAREMARFTAASEADRAHDRDMSARHTLSSIGFYEARTLTLIAESAPLFTSAQAVRRVRNPLTEDQVVLRPSLLPGLMTVLSHNARAGSGTVRLFEIGRVFGERETTSLTLVLSGPVEERWWRGAGDEAGDLYELKGVIKALELDVDFAAEENARLAVPVSILHEGEIVGHAGQLWPAEARALDAGWPVVVAEIDLGAFAIPRTASRRFAGIDRFPATSRDIALVAPAELAHAAVAQVLESAGEPLLERVELFDVFTDPTGEKIAAGKKSMAYSLTYRAGDRTLTLDEANEAHARLKDRLRAELSVAFRE